MVNEDWLSFSYKLRKTQWLENCKVVVGHVWFLTEIIFDKGYNCLDGVWFWCQIVFKIWLSFKVQGWTFLTEWLLMIKFYVFISPCNLFTQIYVWNGLGFFYWQIYMLQTLWVHFSGLMNLSMIVIYEMESFSCWESLFFVS